MISQADTDLIERLAAVEHAQWQYWATWMLDNQTTEEVERWRDLLKTPYAELAEQDKNADREWATRALNEIRGIKNGEPSKSALARKAGNVSDFYLLGSDLIGASSDAPTAKERYDAAMLYAKREVAQREAMGLGTNIIDLLAIRNEIAPFKSDIVKIESLWKKAVGESGKNAAAREAELLADRVQELLQGASQARTKTNTSNRSGIVPTGAPDDGYTEREKSAPVQDYWWHVKSEAKSDLDAVKNKFKWPWWGTALIIGGVAVGGLVLIGPLLMQIFVAKAGRTQIVVGGRPTQRRLTGQH